MPQRARITLDEDEHVELDIAGLTVEVFHRHDGDEHFVELKGGAGLKLTGEMPGLYYLESIGDAEPAPLDYHSRCELEYESTLEALRRAGLGAELIDTGGSCKAIVVDGYGGRAFDGSVHLLLTAGGPLSDERDESCEWEVGLYGSVEEYGTVDKAMLTRNPPLHDRTRDDQELAEWLVGVAEVIR